MADPGSARFSTSESRLPAHRTGAQPAQPSGPARHTLGNPAPAPGACRCCRTTGHESSLPRQRRRPFHRFAWDRTQRGSPSRTAPGHVPRSQRRGDSTCNRQASSTQPTAHGVGGNRFPGRVWRPADGWHYRHLCRPGAQLLRAAPRRHTVQAQSHPN